MEKREFFGLLLLFTFLGFMVLAPFPSHDYLPRPNDFLYHVYNISQAHHALFSGQLWLRVAPQYLHGWSYPLFQFYAPFAYMISAFLSILMQNPLELFKYTLLIMLVISGCYNYRLYLLLLMITANAQT